MEGLATSFNALADRYKYGEDSCITHYSEIFETPTDTNGPLRVLVNYLIIDTPSLKPTNKNYYLHRWGFSFITMSLVGGSIPPTDATASIADIKIRTPVGIFLNNTTNTDFLYNTLYNYSPYAIRLVTLADSKIHCILNSYIYSHEKGQEDYCFKSTGAYTAYLWASYPSNLTQKTPYNTEAQHYDPSVFDTYNN